MMTKVFRGVVAAVALATFCDVLVLACRIVGVWCQVRLDDASLVLEAILEP